MTRSLGALKVLDAIEVDWVALGWEQVKAHQLIENLRGSLNQAAYVMQELRSRMGDVHGTKPTLRPLVFDSLRWATVIVRMFRRA